jgi:hypothetical protein
MSQLKGYPDYVGLNLQDRTDVIIQYFNTLDIGTYINHKEYGSYDVDIEYTDKIDGNKYSWFVDVYTLHTFYNSELVENSKPQVIDEKSWVSKFNKILQK